MSKGLRVSLRVSLGLTAGSMPLQWLSNPPPLVPNQPFGHQRKVEERIAGCNIGIIVTKFVSSIVMQVSYRKACRIRGPEQSNRRS